MFDEPLLLRRVVRASEPLLDTGSEAYSL
jgi:hypothetical protein